jgi:hypothetical protein
MKTLLIVLAISFYVNTLAQGSYAPGASTIGTTAIHKDSSIFINWASSCVVNRGWQNIHDHSLGKASSGTSANAIGKSGVNGTVSLGDNGDAILTFQHPIINGTGYDFAVFENAFDDFFLELAFVEVSSDGVNYVRFPSYSETQTTTQVGGFDLLEPTNIHNLAGKYKVGYGTPFDLEELIDSTLIDVNNINYIKIIDVIGVVNDPLSSVDSDSNPINDPFPTPYPTSGFDLDAVGVIHQFVGVNNQEKIRSKLYPNPSNGNFTIEYSNNDKKSINLYNSIGNLILSKNTNTTKLVINESLASGIYILKTTTQGKTVAERIIIQ